MILDERHEAAFVSTGELPAQGVVEALVLEAHARYRSVDDGRVSDVYPALARVPRHLFGVCVMSSAGEVHATGDADVELTIQSIAKPFTFALLCDVLGGDEVARAVGLDATGLPFDSIVAVELRGDGRTNPMVNPGAITTSSLAPGDSAEDRWRFLVDGLSRFAGRQLQVDEEVYASASASNHRNQAIARLLRSYGRLGCDPSEALDLYTRQCCLRVTTRDLAVMGATLADGGVNPRTGDAVVDAAACHGALAVMTTAGLYEASGDWLHDVGVPAKSGIGGGIVSVSPGKGGLVTFSPPLDRAGNSVRGRLATRFLSHRLGLDLFRSVPVPTGGDEG